MRGVCGCVCVRVHLSHVSICRCVLFVHACIHAAGEGGGGAELRRRGKVHHARNSSTTWDRSVFHVIRDAAERWGAGGGCRHLFRGCMGMSVGLAHALRSRFAGILPPFASWTGGQYGDGSCQRVKLGWAGVLDEA